MHYMRHPCKLSFKVTLSYHLRKNVKMRTLTLFSGIILLGIYIYMILHKVNLSDKYSYMMR